MKRSGDSVSEIAAARTSQRACARVRLALRGGIVVLIGSMAAARAFAGDGAPLPTIPPDVDEPEVSAGDSDEEFPPESSGSISLQTLGIDLRGAQRPRAERTVIDLPLVRTEEDQRIAGYAVGSVDWRYSFEGEPVRIQADLLVVFADLADRIRDDDASGESDAEEASRARASDSVAPATVSGQRFRRVTAYARGRVRVDLERQGTHLEADELYFEHPTGIGVARGVRLMTTVERAVHIPTVIESKLGRGTPANDVSNPHRPLYESPLVLRAEELLLHRFQYFRGRRVRATNSQLAVPPIALASDEIEVFPADLSTEELAALRRIDPRAEVDASGELERLRDRLRAERETGTLPAFIIDPDGTWVSILDQPVAPLPVGYWDTRWNDFMPIRSIEPGSSSQFGPFLGVNWNVNYLARLFPLGDSSGLERFDRNARLGFDTVYYDRRGFGWGPNGAYGLRPRRWGPWQTEQLGWSFTGDGRYFRIEDRGDEDRTTRLPVPRESRDWGRIWHRQAIPYVGLLDLEYSKLSDRAFLGEFFEREAKEEKEQETLAYWRRNVRDNLAVTALAKVRTNDFATVTERLPEGRFSVFQQPVFSTGLYTDLTVQAAHLRVRPDDATGLPDRRFGRFDVRNEWSYPLRLLSPYLDALPFAFGRYSAFEEVLDPLDQDEDRVTFGAGVTLSQQWSRVFALDEGSLVREKLGIERLKHIVVPRLTYLNVTTNDLAPERLIGVDAVDTVDLEESFSLSLRNELHSRRRLPGELRSVSARLGEREALATARYATDRVFDSDISVVVYPQRRRDNGGDRSSFLRLDNTLYVRRVSFRYWSELNPNRDFRLERVDASASIQLVPDALRLIVGDRLTRRRTNVLYGNVRFWLNPKWAFDAFYAHDFERRRDVEIRVGVTRVFDRFALSFSFEEDVGEDRNRTYYVNFMPVEMLRAQWFR